MRGFQRGMKPPRGKWPAGLRPGESSEFDRSMDGTLRDPKGISSRTRRPEGQQHSEVGRTDHEVAIKIDQMQSGRLWLLSEGRQHQAEIGRVHTTISIDVTRSGSGGIKSKHTYLPFSIKTLCSFRFRIRRPA